MKKALIIIDMQNDFITGALGSSQARAVLPRVAAKIQAHIKDGGDLFFTRDTHGADYPGTAEGRRLPVVHCIEDSEGWMIAGELSIAIRDYPVRIIDKRTFGSLELALSLKDAGYDEIEICGLVSSVCVVSNALIIKAALPETRIILDASCTAGVTDEDYRASLCVMRMCHIDIEEEGRSACASELGNDGESRL
jgi:nicotinamidase-related amidase